jgi:hypothetical protein
MINFGLYLTYTLIGLSVVAILFFAVSKILQEPGGAKSALIGIVGLVVVVLLGYLLSTGEDANTLYAKLKVTEAVSHRVGTGLMSLYIIMGLTILSIFYAEITRLLK